MANGNRTSPKATPKELISSLLVTLGLLAITTFTVIVFWDNLVRMTFYGSNPASFTPINVRQALVLAILVAFLSGSLNVVSTWWGGLRDILLERCGNALFVTALVTLFTLLTLVFTDGFILMPSW